MNFDYMTEEEEKMMQLSDMTVEDKQKDMFDPVARPKHYQLMPGVEVYDLRQALAHKAMQLGIPHDIYSDWDRALEYMIRMWEKNKLEDAKKSRWYLDKIIDKLEGDQSA